MIDLTYADAARKIMGPIVAQLVVLEFAMPLNVSIDCWISEV